MSDRLNHLQIARDVIFMRLPRISSMRYIKKRFHLKNDLTGAPDSYHKLRQLFYYKVRHFLLQIATGITKCDGFIKNCERYYKVRWLLQIATEQTCLIYSSPAFFQFYLVIFLWQRYLQLGVLAPAEVLLQFLSRSLSIMIEAAYALIGKQGPHYRRQTPNYFTLLALNSAIRSLNI